LGKTTISLPPFLQDFIRRDAVYQMVLVDGGEKLIVKWQGYEAGSF